MYSIPSAQVLEPRPPCIYSGRADNACTNLLGFFVHFVRTRGIAEIARSAKSPTFALPFAAHTCHAWLARLTRARRGGSQREGNALFADFWYFSSLKSTIKEKLLYDSSRANNVRPLSRRRQHTCFAYVLIPLQYRVEALSASKIKTKS